MVTKHRHNTRAKKLCRCVKTVRAKTKNESRAIAICVHSVLQQRRGITLKRFSCRGKKPHLETQPILQSKL